MLHWLDSRSYRRRCQMEVVLYTPIDGRLLERQLSRQADLLERREVWRLFYLLMLQHNLFRQCANTVMKVLHYFLLLIIIILFDLLWFDLVHIIQIYAKMDTLVLLRACC